MRTVLHLLPMLALWILALAARQIGVFQATSAGCMLSAKRRVESGML